jgi:hypothetical protein
MGRKDGRMLDETVFGIKKLEISSQKCQGLAGPFAGIWSGGNALETLPLLEPRLGKFCDSGTGKDAQAEPVPHGVYYKVEKLGDGIRRVREQGSGMLREHPVGEWFLLCLGFAPRVSLGYHLLEIRVE